MLRSLAILLIVPGMTLGAEPFYVAENADFTITDSAIASVQFTLEKTVRENDRGHLVSISSFVNPDGQIMDWHDFGNLEGPGWAANAAGGAHEIYRLSQFLRRPDWQHQSLQILDHVLEAGFLEESGLIRGYRVTTTGEFCLNYKHDSSWFCPGSMAKIGYQLLCFADDLPNDPRAPKMREAAIRCAAWLDKNLPTVPNGWFPRRVTETGQLVRKSPEGGDDPFWQTSADGLFILQLQAALTARGLADYRSALRQKVDVFIAQDGIFGSINHDTYDPHENVAYSVAFRTLRRIAPLLEDDSIREFAEQKCLQGLEQFKMADDRNGVATRGLLFMERSWDTAYLWENAEAALAYFEAASDLQSTRPDDARRYEQDGLVILRAIAKHHYGEYGFLTEGVDWNNHVGQQHHIDQAEFGAIQYTEPFLNNQHIVEPTLFYLTELAERQVEGTDIHWVDCEGNVLYQQAN